MTGVRQWRTRSHRHPGRHGFLRSRLNAIMETHQVMNGSSVRDFNQSRQPWRLALVDADVNLHHAVRDAFSSAQRCALLLLRAMTAGARGCWVKRPRSECLRKNFTGEGGKMAGRGFTGIRPFLDLLRGCRSGTPRLQ